MSKNIPFFVVRRLFRFMTPAQKRRYLTQEILKTAARQRATIYNIKTKTPAGHSEEK